MLFYELENIKIRKTEYLILLVRKNKILMFNFAQIN